MNVTYQNAGDAAVTVRPPRTSPAPDPMVVAARDPYPEGNANTVKAVLAWITRAPTSGLRSERAKAAITAEHDRDKPRSSLLRELTNREDPG